MNKTVFLRFAIAGLCALSISVQPITVQAEQGDTRVDFELEAGLEQDSSLTVEELDQSSEESDTAVLSKAKLNAQWKPTKPVSLKAGYNYTGRNFRDSDSFDTVIQQFFVDGSYAAGLATLGASHYFADAQLDNRDLLTLNLSSLYVSKLIDQHIFLRFAMDFKDKSFDRRPERDADGNAMSGDIYIFFNQARSYVSFGLNTEKEDSNSSELDYRGTGVKAKVSNKFLAFGKDNKISLAYQFNNRDYHNIDPLIGEKREDRRQRTELAWEFWFNDTLALISSLVRGNYQSNLESADYEESLASLALRLKF